MAAMVRRGSAWLGRAVKAGHGLASHGMARSGTAW